MSKKTNLLKQKAKRRHPRKKRPNPAFQVPPINFAGLTGPAGPPLQGDIPKLVQSMTDMILGQLFVQALKKTGTREAVLKFLFPKDEEKDEPDKDEPDPPVVQ